MQHVACLVTLFGAVLRHIMRPARHLRHVMLRLPHLFCSLLPVSTRLRACARISLHSSIDLRDACGILHNMVPVPPSRLLLPFRHIFHCPGCLAQLLVLAFLCSGGIALEVIRDAFDVLHACIFRCCLGHHLTCVMLCHLLMVQPLGILLCFLHHLRDFLPRCSLRRLRELQLFRFFAGDLGNLRCESLLCLLLLSLRRLRRCYLRSSRRLCLPRLLPGFHSCFPAILACLLLNDFNRGSPVRRVRRLLRVWLQTVLASFVGSFGLVSGMLLDVSVLLVAGEFLFMLEVQFFGVEAMERGFLHSLVKCLRGLLRGLLRSLLLPLLFNRLRHLCTCFLRRFLRSLRQSFGCSLLLLLLRKMHVVPVL